MLQGKYQIGMVLGWGGFGITYLGYDEALDRTLAIKEYFPTSFATRNGDQTQLNVFPGEGGVQFREGLKRFIEEARRLSKLNRLPGTVDIHDYFEANGTGYIVMEHLDGKTVKELLLTNGAFPYQDALRIILPVLETLREVHKSDIVHRDIAPDNIFVLNDGSVRLIDFGASRHATAADQKTLSVILKPGYAPEEQYRARGEQGPWTDVYAVAATFYKMITDVTPEDSIDRLVQDSVVPPSALGAQVSPQVEFAIMNAMRVNARERTQNAEEFMGQLTMQRAPAKPVKAVPAAASPGPKKTSPLLFAGIGVAAAAVVLIFVLVFNNGSGTDDGSDLPSLVSGGTVSAGTDTDSGMSSAGSPGTANALDDSQPDADENPIENTTVSVIPAVDSIGQQITFGNWRGKPIVWQVLDIAGDTALVISKDVLAVRQYHEEMTDITWADSSLRHWLNKDFLQSAFSPDEQDVILTTSVDNPGNAEWGTYGGVTTQDKLFSLSIEEAYAYFPSDGDRAASIEITQDDVSLIVQAAKEDLGYTQQELSQLTPTLESDYLGKRSGWWWWLRSPGRFSYRAAGVRNDGFVYTGVGGVRVVGVGIGIDYINSGGGSSGGGGGGVRPAMWIQIK
jgi:serine/threonine protein kinase